FCWCRLPTATRASRGGPGTASTCFPRHTGRFGPTSSFIASTSVYWSISRGWRKWALGGKLKVTSWKYLLRQRRLGRGQAGDRDAEWGATYVAQADLVAEVDGARIAPVFTADAHFHSVASGAALGNGRLHQLPDAYGIDRGEGIRLDDFSLLIGRQERTGIVAAHAQAHLRQVVGAEAEEFGRLGDLIGGQSPARHFDHGT